ncbi:MAG: cytochrome c oxidase assembly protein [Alphaproteobacteria bacterium]|nr:cytochrome c oxidase assembly protein [Alphaproteobacteria bacterium]
MDQRRHRPIVLATLAGVAAMIGLVAASVPLYGLYCRLTGAGGTPRVATEVPPEMSARMVTVRFDASLAKGLAKGLDWEFVPSQRQMRVHLGEPSLAFYRATNRSSQTLVGTAVFNVTPDKAGQFFNKTECFCFTEQRLEPGQSAELPVSFFVDSDLAEDIDTVTLSYTFYLVPERQGRS